MRGAGAAILLALLLLPAGCADPARERFERAEKAFLAHRMDEALELYRSVPREYPQSRYAPAALLRVGDLYGSFHRNYEAALEAYESLSYNYPTADEAPQAGMRKAEIHLRQSFDYRRTVTELERIRTKTPRFPRMDEVLLLLAEAFAGIPEPEREVLVLQELLERFPESPRGKEARWRLAYAFLKRGSFPDADREFRKLLYLSSDPGEAARARWGIGQSLEGMGRYAEALSQYEAIGEDWEDPSYVAEKIRWLRERIRKG